MNLIIKFQRANQTIAAAVSIVLMLILGTNTLSAQVNFQPGYIVKNSGDTLSGWLDYRVSGVLNQSCSFRLNKDAPITVFKPDELSAYHFDNDKTFVSEKVDGAQQFIEVLFNGCVSVYFLKTALGDDRFFMRKKNAELLEVTYKEERVVENDKVYLKESAQHIIVLKKLMKDQVELFERIDQMGRPNAFNLVPLARAYQKKACPEQADAPTKRGFKLGLAIEGVGGTVNYQDIGFFTDKSYFQPGVLLHLGSARNAGKIFLRTGLLISQLEERRGTKSLLKIPIQVEYLYPGPVFRPRLAAGVSIFKPLYNSITLTAGFNVKVMKSSFLSFNYDFDVKPLTVFFLVPSNQVLGNTFSLGFYQRIAFSGKDVGNGE
ncbi:MAG TPA: hypothetical protein PLC89_15370 [Haliscomenobacter sp.]|uniref:hypothetical protein n=1 Tax=Haliscomenobacter sp. TaxID=2717303 RepID=UPI002B840761|nr:hypothetical protein [Haliscomenobacter sp.]HOY18681.1 hypothetical protein [Haliscomenobacter sp.]